MTTGELVTAILMFVIAGILLLFSIRSFLERGFLLNNAYLYASKEERKSMNKKPYYRQTAIVFCILSAVFIVIGLSLVLQNDKIMLLEIPLILGAVIYAIASAVRISREEKKKALACRQSHMPSPAGSLTPRATKLSIQVIFVAPSRTLPAEGQRNL